MANENNDICFQEFLDRFNDEAGFGPVIDIQSAIGEFDLSHAISQLHTLPMPSDYEDYPVAHVGSTFYVADGYKSKMRLSTIGFLAYRQAALYHLERGDHMLAVDNLSLALKCYANTRQNDWRADPKSILLSTCRHIGIND